MARIFAIIFVFLALFGTLVNAATVPSPAVVTLAKAALSQLIQSNRQSFIPGFVRLAFHDCVSAKCDGCIDTARSGFASF
jgi:hypothetical protein